MNAIEASHLTKAFGSRKAVDDITFALPQGAFLSIFGPNGAGKTTLLNMLSTLSRPTSGTVVIAGADAKERPDETRERIGCISHLPMLYPDLTAQENLLFYAQLYGVPNPRARVDELLDAVELSHRKLDVVRSFSRGMTQRIAIARALIHDPKIVLLDEPYSGLDPHGMRVFDEIIGRIREGRTFIMVSHDLKRGIDACTHVLVMSRGRMACFLERELVDPTTFADLYADTVSKGAPR